MICAHNVHIKDCVPCHQLEWALIGCGCTSKPTNTYRQAHRVVAAAGAEERKGG